MANTVLISGMTNPGPWTTTGSGTATTYTLDTTSIDNSWSGVSPMHVNQGGKITLKGSDADLDINGVSLKKTLQGIQERLGILEVNKELEKEFEQLQELGRQYREMEARLLEQKQVFDILKNKNIK